MRFLLEQIERIDPRIPDRQLDGVKRVLMRLPVRGDKLYIIGDAANMICVSAKITRALGDTLFGRQSRKPVAGVTTAAAAGIYQLLTGKSVTRVSQAKKGELGQKEAGRFAQFLGELFDTLEIDARPAGQVKLIMRVLRDDGAVRTDDDPPPWAEVRVRC
ncbi:MAG: hypothetical protein ACREYF_00355 [Gammaproteobacteria bacterium]